MLNVSSLGYLDLQGPVIQQIAGDQGLLSSMLQLESLVLAPGDRAELEWLAEQDQELRTGRYTASGGVAIGESLPLMSVQVDGPEQSLAPLSWPFSGLPSSVDPGNTEITYVFSGGATGETWLINGESYPNVTVESLPLNQEAILEIRNLSATEHPFHMHGHAFEVLSIDGTTPPGRRLEDTINVGIRQVVRIKMLASNPGDWMVHCHLLEHEEGGMMTVLRVE
jgi:FtsP/CotA-like multicopper oxidase with cupredoxin domain